MSESVEMQPSWLERNLDAIGAALWRDKVVILIVTLVLGLFGAIGGKITNKITSTAYLVLTPLPLREANTEDKLAQMIAPPLQVTTASLLCTSDEVFAETLKQFNDRVAKLQGNGQAPDGIQPLSDIWKVKNALQYEITIEKETPYDTVASPILQLTAQSATPAQAKLLVDTWAEECVKAARKLQMARQGPMVAAFEAQAKEQLNKLQELDERVKEFWTENSPQLLEEQLNMLIGLTRNYRDGRWEAEQKINTETARNTSLDAALQQSQPVLKLHWTAPERLLSLAGPLASPGTPPAPADGDAIVLEQQNPVYTELTKEAAVSKVTVAGEEARIKTIDELLKEFEDERLVLQKSSAEVKLVQEQLMRDSEVYTETYKDAAKKLEYARMAKSLEQPDLQILSYGAEWPLPRFRRAILFGGFSAVAGFMAAALFSVILRVILEPYFEAVRA